MPPPIHHLRWLTASVGLMKSLSFQTMLAPFNAMTSSFLMQYVRTTIYYKFWAPANHAGPPSHSHVNGCINSTSSLWLILWLWTITILPNDRTSGKALGRNGIYSITTLSRLVSVGLCLHKASYLSATGTHWVTSTSVDARQSPPIWRPDSCTKWFVPQRKQSQEAPSKWQLLLFAAPASKEFLQRGFWSVKYFYSVFPQAPKQYGYCTDPC